VCARVRFRVLAIIACERACKSVCESVGENVKESVVECVSVYLRVRAKCV
jgi:hypothetical protein